MTQKKTWNSFRGLLGTNVAQYPSFVEENGKVITKPVDYANHYAAYFENKINKLRKMTDFSSPKDALNDLISRSKMCSFSFSFVTTEEVMNLLESLPDGKAAGYDLMNNRLLSYAAPQIATPLRYLFNWSIDTGHFPKVWKRAKLCPIPKNSKEPVSPENSRPISLLPALC